MYRTKRAASLRRLRQLRDKAVQWSDEYKPLFLIKVMAGARSNAFRDECYAIAGEALRMEKSRHISGAPAPRSEGELLFGKNY